ncbi:MAG: ABC transporter ATP-binding protein [Candidatus Njordarchaeales archaeon]
MSEVICENVIKIYKSGDIEVIALRGLDLRVDKGELRAIVGPSGSGKTTLINLIGGIDRPSAGKIIVDGINIGLLPEKQLMGYRRKHVGIVFQFFNLIPVLTALENVELPMVLAGVPREKRRKRAIELLRLVGLEKRMNHRPDQLSGGEQQRVAIAAALANDPPLILADEPTGELDTATSRQIAEIFKQLSKELGKTVIIVTHDVAIASLADRISRIEDGKIISTITPAELKLLEIESLAKHEVIKRLEERKKAIEEEINRIEKAFKEGKIGRDEFVNRYLELKEKLREVEKEISLHTV